MFDLLRHVAPQRGYKGRDVLIVAEDIEYDRLATLVLHAMSSGTKVNLYLSTLQPKRILDGIFLSREGILEASFLAFNNLVNVTKCYFLSLFIFCGFLNCLKVCVIKPGFGESRKAILLELTELTGGKVGLFNKFPTSILIII